MTLFSRCDNDRRKQILPSAESVPVEDVDFVLVAGHFLSRDENIFSLLTGESEYNAVGSQNHASGNGKSGATRDQQAAMASGAMKDQHLSPSLAERFQSAPPTKQQPQAIAASNGASRLPPEGEKETPSRPSSRTGDASPFQGMSSSITAHHHHHHHGGSTMPTGVHAVAPHDLPFHVPPAYSFTCTVGRGLSSKAGYMRGEVM